MQDHGCDKLLRDACDGLWAHLEVLGVHDALITVVPAPRQLRVETVEMPGTACLGVHSAAVTPLLLEPCVTPFSRLQMVGPLQAGE